MGGALNTKTDAFGALYASNQGRIRGLLSRMVGPQEAEDLTQVTFAKAAQALPAFRGKAEVSTWLYRLAVNVALDWLRSRLAHEAKLTGPLPEPSTEENAGALTSAATIDPSLSPEQELAHKDMHACIRGEIAKLPDPYREVLMLSFLGELNDDEIANALGITVGNAKVRLHRAKQDFKKVVEARCDFYRNELSCKPASSECCAQQPAPADGQMPL
ncbi:MAG: sigma-70 family RNA polymerase sigma factor [Bradyrhizobium sp.]|jgi:RNA polymerase sigma-70 factor (ECF subfamily)